jgi:hypothetical protein
MTVWSLKYSQAIDFFGLLTYFPSRHIFEHLSYSDGHIFKILYYIILLFTIFKIINSEKIYFLKLCLDGLQDPRQN